MQLLAAMPREEDMEDSLEILHRRGTVARLKELGSDLMQLGVRPKALSIPDTGEVFRQVRRMGVWNKQNKLEARKVARLKEVFEEIDDDVEDPASIDDPAPKRPKLDV